MGEAPVPGAAAVGRPSAGSPPPRLLLLAAAAVSVLVLAPLLVTALDAVRGGFTETLRLLFRPITGRLLANTLGLSVVVGLAGAVVSVAMAWLVERTDLPGYRVWRTLAPLPLALPAFVASYAWLSIGTVFEGAAGAALVVTSTYYPLVYLPVAAVLRNLDPGLEETARTLGLSPLATFRRVTLPQLRPALFGGLLLLVLHVLTEFGAFELLRFRTFTTAIYSSYNAGLAAQQGASLACVLLILCVLCLAIEQRMRGSRRYARIGSGTRRAPARYALGRMRLPALAFMAAVMTVSLGVPLFMICYWLTQTDADAVATASASPARLVRAGLHSVGYGLAAGALTTLLALPIAFLATRFRRTSVLLMERATYLAKGMPGIVVALALVTLSLQVLRPLYQTPALLVLGYSIIFMPLAIVSLRTTIAQIEPELEQAARGLGSHTLGVFGRVVLPLAAPGIGAAAALVFIAVSTELTTTLLLIPTDASTLATQIWAASSTFAFAAAAPYAAVLSGISLLATWLLANRFGRSAIAQG